MQDPIVNHFSAFCHLLSRVVEQTIERGTDVFKSCSLGSYALHSGATNYFGDTHVRSTINLKPALRYSRCRIGDPKHGEVT